MRLNNLDLNLIKTFVFVAEEKSFTKAAKRLFIEQSSVSKAIKRFEDEIGATLFLRTKKYVELTSKDSSHSRSRTQFSLSRASFCNLK